MQTIKNTIIKEMLMDLRYRLLLAYDIFGQATESIMSAMGIEDFAAKAQAVESMRSYSQALQIVYADFMHVIDGCSVAFPPEMTLWQWNEQDADERIALTLERLHNIAEGLEAKISGELTTEEIC